MTRQYKIFDAHTHAFPDAIARGAVGSMSERAGIPHYHDGSHEGLLQYERNGGADGFLLLPIATKPGQTRSVNAWAASKMGGPMRCFGSIHPENHDFDALLDEVKDLGLLGIKFHPEYQDFFVDEPRYFPLYEAIFARGLLLCFHAGVDLSYEPPLHASARRIAKVCDAFPDERIIAAHMGGYQEFDDAMEFLAGRENLWMDTAYVADRLTPADFAAIARKHGTDRVLFATDSPWTSFDASLSGVLNAGFTDGELKAILHDNAMRLLDN